MGNFKITGPDGKSYKIAGETAEGAMAALKKHLATNPGPEGVPAGDSFGAQDLAVPSPPDALAEAMTPTPASKPAATPGEELGPIPGVVPPPVKPAPSALRLDINATPMDGAPVIQDDPLMSAMTADMVSRRAVIQKKLADPNLTPETRAVLEERLRGIDKRPGEATIPADQVPVLAPEEKAAAAAEEASKNYTPLGEAILSELGNVPERLQRGFAGNSLLTAEMRQRNTLERIGIAKGLQDPTDEIAAADLELAQINAKLIDPSLRSEGETTASLSDALGAARERRQMLDTAAGRTEGVIETARQHFEDAQAKRAGAEKTIADAESTMEQTNPRPGFDQALVSGIASMGDMAPGMATTLVARNPLPMLMYLGAYSRGSTYADKRGAGVPSDKAANAANLYALAEAIPEMLPLHVILKGGSGALSKIVGGAVTEAPSEAVTSGLQTLVDIGLLDENTTWGEALQQAKVSAEAGGVMGGLMGIGATVYDAGENAAQRRKAAKDTPADPNANPPLPQTPKKAPEPLAAVTPDATPAMPQDPAADPLASAMGMAPPTIPKPKVDAKAYVTAELRNFATKTAGAVIPPGSPAASQMDSLIAKAERAGMTDDEINAALSGKPEPLKLTAEQRVEDNPKPEPKPEPTPTPKVEAKPDPAPAGDFEVMDEVETIDGEERPTGRKVRVNLNTGDAEVVEDSEIGGDGQASAGTGGGTAPTPEEGKQAVADGSPSPSVEPSRPNAETAPTSVESDKEFVGDRPPPVRKFLTSEETLAIKTNPKAFQYKSNGDEEGVTDALRNIKTFDPNRAGQVVLFERKDGTLEVADGHQRTGLARRAAAAGQADVGGTAATVYREADGYTAEEVMGLAALKNIGEGSGSAVDAARVLRTRKESIADLGLPPNSALVRKAEGIRRLGDDAFGMVANGVASEEYGDVVGRNVPDQALQAEILAMLMREKPDNLAQAAMIARDAASTATTETQTDMFGTMQVQKSLYVERAKVLDAAMKSQGILAKTFRNLVEREGVITSAGNKLDTDANAALVDEAGKIRQYLQSQANMKGAISDALTKAAELIRSGTPVSRATEGFVRDVKSALQGAGTGGPQPAPAGTGNEGRAPGQDQAVTPAPEPGDDLFGAMIGTTKPAETPKPTKNTDNDLFAAMGGTPAQTGKTPDQVRAEAEAKVKAAQSKAGTTKPQADAGPLFDDQADIEKPKPAAPVDLIARGRETLKAYEKPGDERFISPNSRDLRNDPMVKDLAAKMAAANTAEAREKLADAFVLENGRAAGKEFLIILGPNGEILAATMGDKGNVGASPAVWRAVEGGKAGYATHNHPGSGDFSGNDLMMLGMGIKRIVAMGHDGTRHVATAVPGAIPKTDLLSLSGSSAFRRSSSILTMMRDILWDLALPQAAAWNPLNKSDRLQILNRGAFSIILDRMGIISYSGATVGDVTASGLDFGELYGRASSTFADRLGRAGFVVSERGDPAGNQAAGSDAGTARPDADGADQGTALPDGQGDGKGRVPEPVAPAADDGFAGVWQGMTPNARYDAIIKAKLAALVRSGNDGHVWRLVDAKWENLTERQREALRFEIPEPSAKTPPADDFDTAADDVLDDIFGATPAKTPANPGKRTDADIAKDLGGLFNEDPAKFMSPMDRRKAKAKARPARQQDLFDMLNAARPGERQIDLEDYIDEKKAADRDLFGFGEDVISTAKYAQAVPLFREILAGQDVAAQPVIDTIRAVALRFKDNGLTRDGIERMLPYLKLYLQDVQAGKLTNPVEDTNVPGTNGSVEPDRGDTAAGDTVGQVDLPPAGGRPGAGGTGRGAAPDDTGGQRDAGNGVPDGRTPPVGTQGNPAVENGERGKPGSAVDRDGAGGRDTREQRPAPDSRPAAHTQLYAVDTSNLAVTERQALQAEADKLTKRDGVKLADEANVRQSLPLLKPEQQDDVIKIEKRYAKPNGHGMLLTNGTGTGKAQPLDAGILTPTGWRRMGDLAVGDRVIAADGHPTSVTGVFPQGEKPIYRVEFSDGAATECCDEHLWETQTLYERRKGRTNPTWDCAKPKVRSLAEIRASLNAQHFTPVAPAIQHPARALPVRPYTLGVILGDGCIRQSAITVSSQDEQMADALARDMDDNFRVVRTGEARCPTWRISDDHPVKSGGRFGGHRMTAALRDIGLMGAGSAEKFIPSDYLTSSIVDRIGLLQGLMDTDGTVDHRTGSVSFCTVSSRLADGITALVRSLGGTASRSTARKFYSHNGERREGQIAYIITMHLPNEIAPFRLSRKAALVRPKLHAPRRKIVAVSLVGEKPAQCIAVDHPRHLYVTDDYVLTHNTYSGGGQIKRFVQAGKNNILIVAPSQGILDHWERALADMGIEASRLDDTKSSGKGVTLTTYANMGENETLADRDWDLVVTDEAHKLSQNADGDATAALQTLRAITNRPADRQKASMMRRRAEWAKAQAMPDSDIKTNALNRLWALARQDAEAMATKPRAKVLFLSATPFAYVKNTDYAEGYLFDYPSDGVINGSRQPGRNLFMVENFGMRIRYHKLTRPDVGVDTGVFEREFHEKMRRDGVLSGRMLDIDADYDRLFVMSESAEGVKIDEILQFISDQANAKGDDQRTKDYRALKGSLKDTFNYLKQMQLLEAIKADKAVKDIEAHLKLGRKVVVFHDYNVGGGFNPFRPVADMEKGIIPTAEAYAGYARLVAEKPEVEKLNFAGLLPPVEALKKRFGDRAVVYNGTVPQKVRKKAKADFQTDGSGIDVIIVQSAAGEAGIDLHDTTGAHQRALVNLGMPTRPTTALQEEGRTRREGSVTDAPFRYYTIGTAWERRAFAKKIAERSGTVENLALGDMARTIKDSFIEAYSEAETIKPAPGDGKGGKERDRAQAKASPYEVAKTHYYGRMKTTGRRDQREGLDFYPTPEPVAFKMVEWAGIRAYERALEPSAGDGAIARYLPEHARRTIIEPSMELLSKAELRASGSTAINRTFEDYHIANKHHAIVMNPPFGSGGKTAMEHLAKAAKHLKPGGRIVALIPEGPSANKRFDDWRNSPEAADFHLTAYVQLPAVTFEKAGTAIQSRVVVLDKVGIGQARTDWVRANGGEKPYSLHGASTIEQLFDRLEDMTLPPRVAQRFDPTEEIDLEVDEDGEPIEQPIEVVAKPAKIGRPIADSMGGFKLAQTKHGKTGADLFVATAENRVDDDAYKTALAVAKSHGGWYSYFKGSGAIPGFQFKSEAQRQAFLDDMGKPTIGGMEEAAYHGTPHEFDRFSLDKIGTGEGAQTYGWGLYFAGNREVAEHYRNKLTVPKVQFDGDIVPSFFYGDLSSKIIGQVGDLLTQKPAEKPAEISADDWHNAQALLPITLFRVFNNLRDKLIYSPGDDPAKRLGIYRETALARYEAYAADGRVHDAMERASELAAIDWLAGRVSVRGAGQLLKVEVPDTKDLMDWDATMADQPTAVREAIEAAWFNLFPHLKGLQGPADSATGQDIYQELSASVGKKPASEALRRAGIPGHRYLDQGSRGKDGGTHNYVIYDEDRVQITGFEEPVDRFQRPEFPNVDDVALQVDANQAMKNMLAIMPKLRKELDRLNLKRVKLYYDPMAEWHGRIEIDNPNNHMAIFVGATGDAMATIHHEVIHALYWSNLFTPQEWHALKRAAMKGRWLQKYDINKRYPDLSYDERLEEAIAEEFGEVYARRQPVPKDSAVITAFNKIVRFLKAVFTAQKKAGFPTAEDVFGKVLSGEIGARFRPGQAMMSMSEARNRYQKARLPGKQARAHMATPMGGQHLHIPDRSIWQELSRAGAPIWQRLTGGVGAARDAVDRARMVIQDRMLPVLRAQTEIEKRRGAPLPSNMDPYTVETTFSGKVGRHLFEIDEDFTKPIVTLLAKTQGRLTAEAAGTWLYARHAIERNARIASINPRMPDGGSGMTNAEAQQILRDAAASPDAAILDQIGTLVDQLREKTLLLRQSKGLITAAEANRWRTLYKHYVPLKGWADTDHSDAMLDVSGVGRRYSTRGAESKRALGRATEAFNPLQAAITQAQEVAIRAEKNVVGQAVIELAKAYPSPAMWSVKQVKMKQVFNRTTGLVELRPEDPKTMFLDPNEMAVKVSGQEYRIMFHDPRLARSLGAVGADQMNGVVRILSILSRFFSMTRTMLNPEFMVTNAFRDFQTAQFGIQAFGINPKTKQDDRAAIALAMSKNWRKAFAGVYRGQKNLTNTTWSQYFKEFQKAGANISFWMLDQPEAAVHDLDKRIDLARGTKAARMLKHFRPSAVFNMRDNPVLSFIERTNLAVDNAIRLAAFIKARELGWDVQDAAFLAKELTVNFNRRGETTSSVNALYPFFNAAIQGSMRIGKALTSKRVAILALMSVAAGTVLDLTNAALSDLDDDDELFYDKIPEYRSERNLHLVLWGTGDNPVAIPMPYGYNLFPYAGQQIGKVMRGVKTPEQAFGDVMVAAFGAFSPVNGGSPTTTVAPFIADPFIELAENSNFAGNTIYPAYPGTGLPDSQVFYPSATAASQYVAETLNALTGGDFRQSGYLDFSPETLDHLSQFVGGSAAAFWGRSVDILGKVMSGDLEGIEQRDVPFVRTITTPIGEYVNRDRYRRFGLDVKDAAADAKAYAERNMPTPPDVAAKAALYEAYLAAERELDGKGEWNPTKEGALTPREDNAVWLDFAKKYLKATRPKVSP